MHLQTGDLLRVTTTRHLWFRVNGSVPRTSKNVVLMQLDEGHTLMVVEPHHAANTADLFSFELCMTAHNCPLWVTGLAKNPYLETMEPDQHEGS